MTPIDDDLQGVKDDLDSIRSGSDLADAARRSDRYETDDSDGRPVGKGDVPDLGLGGGEGSIPEWAKRGIYAAVIIAIITIYVPFSLPDGTVLVGAALAFLVLGLWAGARLSDELAGVWERVRGGR